MRDDQMTFDKLTSSLVHFPSFRDQIFYGQTTPYVIPFRKVTFDNLLRSTHYMTSSYIEFIDLVQKPIPITVRLLTFEKVCYLSTSHASFSLQFFVSAKKNDFQLENIKNCLSSYLVNFTCTLTSAPGACASSFRDLRLDFFFSKKKRRKKMGS